MVESLQLHWLRHTRVRGAARLSYHDDIRITSRRNQRGRWDTEPAISCSTLFVGDDLLHVIGPSIAAGFYRLAQALIALGDLAEAASVVEDGLRVDPGECCTLRTFFLRSTHPFLEARFGRA